jgi:hypothetical protein
VCNHSSNHFSLKTTSVGFEHARAIEIVSIFKKDLAWENDILKMKFKKLWLKKISNKKFLVENFG